MYTLEVRSGVLVGDTRMHTFIYIVGPMERQRRMDIILRIAGMAQGLYRMTLKHNIMPLAVQLILLMDGMRNSNHM